MTGDARDWEAFLRFDPVFVDLVARRVIQLTRDDEFRVEETDSDLLTVAEVAARLRVGPKWVYAHKHELGAIKLGDGPKARIRFDSNVVNARLAAEHANGDHKPGPARVTAPSKRRRRRLTSRPLPAVDQA